MVIVDVGLKSEGRIPLNEFSRPGIKPEIETDVAPPPQKPISDAEILFAAEGPVEEPVGSPLTKEEFAEKREKEDGKSFFNAFICINNYYCWSYMGLGRTTLYC